MRVNIDFSDINNYQFELRRLVCYVEIELLLYCLLQRKLGRNKPHNGSLSHD